MFYDNNGTHVSRAKSTFSRTFRRDVTGAHSHFRVGHYSIVICRDGMLIAGKKYNDLGHDYASIKKPEFRASFVRGRVDMLNECENALTKGHPMYDAITRDIDLERAYIATLA